MEQDSCRSFLPPQEEQDSRRQLLPSKEEPITIETLSERADRQQIEIEKEQRPSPRRNQCFGKNLGVRRSKA